MRTGCPNPPQEPSPKLKPPRHPTPPICIPRPAMAACCAIALLPSSLPPNWPESLDSAGVCALDQLPPPLLRRLPPLPPCEEALGTRWPEMRSPLSPYIPPLVTPLLTAVELRWCCRAPTELLGTVDARNAAPAVQVVQFGGCEVDRSPIAHGIVVVFHRRRRRFLEHGQERRIHRGRPAIGHGGG